VSALALSSTMWHVTVTLAGEPVPPERIRLGIEYLAVVHPLLLSGRFAGTRVELRYWDEGSAPASVLASALQLWEQHREIGDLPPWTVVGVEVLDQETFRSRIRPGDRDARVLAHPTFTPFNPVR